MSHIIPPRLVSPLHGSRRHITILIAALGLSAFAGPAPADDLYPYVKFSDFHSARSRAEVRDELRDEPAADRQARNLEYVPPPRMVAGKSRSEVRAELNSEPAADRQARNLEYVPPPQMVAGRSRAEVRAELAEAAAADRLAARHGSRHARGPY